MAIEQELVYKIITEAFPNAKVSLKDLVGDSNHYEVYIKSTNFKGLNKVEQHRMVYEVLKDYIGQDLHALSIKTEEE